MHISREHKFVFVAIPRTSSKSMYIWLAENYGVENPFVGVIPPDMEAHNISPHGMHHSSRVPDEFRTNEYCRFTIVRNPYERRASEQLAVYDSTQHEPVPKPEWFADHMRNRIHSRRVLVGHQRCQWDFIIEADIRLVLYYERLPRCLELLPFLVPERCGEYPRVPERVDRRDRPSFAELYTAEDEELVWQADREDFRHLGYRRHSSKLPANRPDGFWVRP